LDDLLEMKSFDWLYQINEDYQLEDLQKALEFGVLPFSAVEHVQSTLVVLSGQKWDGARQPLPWQQREKIRERMVQAARELSEYRASLPELEFSE
jgi:hypothetical protein